MSLTLKTLESALAGESMSHIKYRYFVKVASKDGFECPECGVDKSDHEVFGY